MQTDIATIRIDALLEDMSRQLAALLQQKNRNPACVVGIHTGGVWLAESLCKRLDIQEQIGSIDISHYRDDYNERGLPQGMRPSSLPVPIDGRHVVLVDDVLMTGRTIRAALNILFDYGRPASVTLVELLDIEAREVPLQADVCGQTIRLPANQRIKLSGPDPLQLELVGADNG